MGKTIRKDRDDKKHSDKEVQRELSNIGNLGLFSPSRMDIEKVKSYNIIK